MDTIRFKKGVRKTAFITALAATYGAMGVEAYREVGALADLNRTKSDLISRQADLHKAYDNYSTALHSLGTDNYTTYQIGHGRFEPIKQGGRTFYWMNGQRIDVKKFEAVNTAGSYLHKASKNFYTALNKIDTSGANLIASGSVASGGAIIALVLSGLAARRRK